MTLHKKHQLNSTLHTKECKKCKEPMPIDSNQLYCTTCYQKIEAIFDKIKKYLDDFPGATAFEIEMEIGIPMHVTNEFVRDGKLIEIPNDFIYVECKGCGCLLLSAHSKYCPPCRKKLELEMKQAIGELTPLPMTKHTGKMHTLFRIKGR